MRRGVKSQIIIRLLGGLGVAGAQDELVRFGLCEELLDQLEALHTQVENQLVSHLLLDSAAGDKEQGQTDKARRGTGCHDRLCCEARHVGMGVFVVLSESFLVGYRGERDVHIPVE